ncbi:hypothetical protein K438DRAFT_702926 [Mycena galopus ATCC 62051]|nr:hypothetical protein K438DRAFT_702926 [Mycena galopus ATCC 62051]
MRPLTLHTSALNDAEYALFTENLASLLDLDTDKDQAEFETQTLTVREVRAWMRGRYAGIPVATIDRILALFPCKDGMLTGGEFFAALRLVLHVEAGKDVDRALAFVQVHPGSAPAAVGPAAVEDTPAAPARTPQRHNPFLSAQPPSSTLTRSKTSPAPAPVLPPRRVAAPALPSGPPLPPPRHPPLPPRSASPPKPSSFSTHIAHPQHITSTLMKQSLQASKTGQWLKQGQAKLEQERVLQVLRSTSTTPRPAFTAEPADYISASGYGSASDDGSRGGSGGGRGRAPPSIPPSASSLEQVALASPPTSLHRAFEDAYREREPPPMHPDRADQNRRSAPASVSSRTSASSGSGSRSGVRASPERIKNQGSPEREREKPPRPPPKPRSLTSHAASSSSSLSSASPFSASASPFQSVSTHPASSSGSPRRSETRTRCGGRRGGRNGRGWWRTRIRPQALRRARATRPCRGVPFILISRRRAVPRRRPRRTTTPHQKRTRTSRTRVRTIILIPIRATGTGRTRMGGGSACGGFRSATRIWSHQIRRRHGRGSAGAHAAGTSVGRARVSGNSPQGGTP